MLGGGGLLKNSIFRAILRQQSTVTCILTMCARARIHTNSIHWSRKSRASWRHFQPINIEISITCIYSVNKSVYNTRTNIYWGIWRYICVCLFALLLFLLCEPCTEHTSIRFVEFLPFQLLVSFDIIIVVIFILMPILGIHSVSHTIFGSMRACVCFAYEYFVFDVRF